MTRRLAQGSFIEVDIASAATCNIVSALGLKVRIVGTTTITSFGTLANKLRLLRFAGILTLTHNATSLILPGGVNITTAAGDTCIAESDASGNWRVRAYQTADGKAVVPPALLDVTNLRFSSGLLADDARWVFNPAGGPMFGSKVDIFATSASAGAGSFFVRAGTTPHIADLGTRINIDILADGTVPTGTTGVDGNVSISSDAAGNVYVENRKGFVISVAAYVHR